MINLQSQSLEKLDASYGSYRIRRAKYDFISGDFRTIETINFDYIDDNYKEFL